MVNNNSISDIPSCPLCAGLASGLFATDKRRSYYRCADCGLVYVAQEYFLTAVEEKQVYDQHQNNPADAGYRTFLSRLSEPVLKDIAPGSCGLDFGSGPGPTLSLMFEECGHSMAIYDAYYAADEQVWQSTYDFITASEVVEHLYHPRFELDRLWSHLRHGGVLALMTKMVIDANAFDRWHYKNDPTHVIFFSSQTFEWLARHWQAPVSFVGADVVLFYK